MRHTDEAKAEDETRKGRSAKSVRFTAVIATAGKPKVYLPLFDPKKDRAFMRAVKENRVLSIRQEPTSKRTDFAASYSYGIGAGNRKIDLFIQAQVLNIFNTFDLCGCGNTVFSNGGANMLNLIGQSVTLRTPFKPFTTVPVEGVNWVKGANFGTPLNRNAFTSPRTFRMTFGVRF